VIRYGLGLLEWAGDVVVDVDCQAAPPARSHRVPTLPGRQERLSALPLRWIAGPDGLRSLSCNDYRTPDFDQFCQIRFATRLPVQWRHQCAADHLRGDRRGRTVCSNHW